MATKAELERENDALREQVRTLQEALASAVRARPQVHVMPGPLPGAAPLPLTWPVYPGTAMPPITLYDNISICAGAAGCAPPIQFALFGG